jgi:hypothetical protein
LRTRVRFPPPPPLPVPRMSKNIHKSSESNENAGNIGSIFEYAVAEEICEHSPCQGLSKTLSARPTRHHASITNPKQAGELLRATDGYGGTFSCRVRPSPRPAFVCSPWRASQGRLVGIRSRRRSPSMAHPGIENENARAAHRPTGETSGRDSSRATATHWSHWPCVSRTEKPLSGR